MVAPPMIKMEPFFSVGNLKLPMEQIPMHKNASIIMEILPGVAPCWNVEKIASKSPLSMMITVT